ncbi:hypothetical protein ACKUFS_01960 [Pseudomonas cannabina]|uniref:Acyl carrier protein n=1 Tax=Pseudomonas syringae pv. maculicola str. ES4326 TaxID=629265 RepID=A0A8T8C499_PSEYM|nr:MULTISPECIES: hypothetical protein [Pseudomonas syringae group]KPB74544.1 Uncharacterized protein AC507_4555 [Pseudomonas syringae pv. maculicola]QHE98445.1 hypothetical protein PMA4326_018835 [Pseudomonas syringae pv. maculicola str. ES4326]QQN23289.1 hypothetical protein JGS08_06430 [Pseudomonas cannabina pv. alisalensis]UBY99114.1 hypothetical protein LCG56_08460 [Pseudomonas cannabina pv. alisalensis]
MNRAAIKQSVFDTLGIILVDKSEIREDATFDDLVLDNEDIKELLDILGKKFGFTFPDFITTQTTALTMVVDMILLLGRESGRETPSNEGKKSRTRTKPRHRH